MSVCEVPVFYRVMKVGSFLCFPSKLLTSGSRKQIAVTFMLISKLSPAGLILPWNQGSTSATGIWRANGFNFNERE